MLRPSTRSALIVPNVLEELHPANITRDTCEASIHCPCWQGLVQEIWRRQLFHETSRSCRPSILSTSSRFGDKTFLDSIQSINLVSRTRADSSRYLPIILALAHELDTLNTVVKRCMAISSHFGQEHTVLTVDQVLYCRLIGLKWSVPE